MRVVLAAVLFLWATALQAATVAIVSGEHPTFSRLVLTMPMQSDWQFGRTPTGYELQIPIADLRYDVSKVFDLIPRDRLKGIYGDPQTGNLHLTMQCACHAIPFSLDAQTIVIDLHDGPAPPTSSFELSLQGDTMPVLQGKLAQRPRTRVVPTAAAASYDWLTGPVASDTTRLADLPILLPELPAEDFSELQQALVAQMADGAARGIVELALSDKAGPDESPPVPTGQLRLTDTVGMRVPNLRETPNSMTADGEVCISDDRLNIADWGEVTDVTGQLARARMQLYGEFDVPQPDHIIAQARLYIFLGFGAEAISALSTMEQDHLEMPLLSAMANVIDGYPTAPPAFDGMAQCDSFAALWAMLAAPRSSMEQPNVAALQRAFSALPRHLRLALGQDVTDRLLALNQPAAAQSIIDAMARGGASMEPATLLAATDLHLHTGADDDAVAIAQTAFDAGGPSTPDALIALVRAKIAADQAIDPNIAVALAAMQGEYAGEPLAPDLAAARILALSGSGQFGAVMAEPAAQIPPVFWDILAQRGSDDDLLQFAFEPPHAAVGTITADTIALRLQALGFGAAAIGWRELGAQTSSEHIPGDMASPTQDDNSNSDRRPELSVDRSREKRWQQDWAAIATIEGDPWRALASVIANPEAPLTTEPPLAQAAQLVASSKTTRELIDGLLQSTALTGG